MSAKKKAAKTAGKSTAKSTGNLKPLSRDDPRRGRGPKRGAPNAGRPPDEFKARMQSMGSRDEVLEHVGFVLQNPDHPDWSRVLGMVWDRGYGKAQQHIDVTTGGESLADVLRKGRDRVAKMRDA